MIGLVAAGRGGGDADPVFFTVPWSPAIAERGGNLPGYIWQTLLFFRDTIMQEIAGAHRLSDTGLFLVGLRLSGDFICAAGYVSARRMLRELAMVDR